MITDKELAAFKAHLVAVGALKSDAQSAVIMHEPVRRSWENMLIETDPVMAPGQFDATLRAALEEFATGRSRSLFVEPTFPDGDA